MLVNCRRDGETIDASYYLINCDKAYLVPRHRLIDRLCLFLADTQRSPAEGVGRSFHIGMIKTCDAIG